ncbi:peptidoglycan editing factor PgeF [bacterium LRH843]|nr:peptidoglycan editing factor PgeF [bacterium LRH843]
MEPFIHKHKRYLSLDLWQQAVPNLVAGFSTRLDGKSDVPFNGLNVGFHVGDSKEKVRDNRHLLAHDLNFALTQWVGSEQVHEASIRKVTQVDAGRGSDCLDTALPRTDGIYTAEQNLLLTSLYADCVPLYFCAPKHQLIGLAHAGWRGTVQLIGPKMIRLWNELEHIPLKDIQVVIGPCISQAAYEVDEKVIKEVNACLVDKNDLPYERLNDKYVLDLRKLNKQLLMNEGLSEQNICVSSICTTADKRMFSHRAEGGKTGRMMSFIGLRT